MATDTIRPLSESTGKRIADTLEILTNGGTLTETTVLIPKTLQTEHQADYYFDANPAFAMPKAGSTLTLTYNGQTYTAKYAGFNNVTNFTPDTSDYAHASVTYYSSYVNVYLEESTKYGAPYVEGDNHIKLEATTERARKGILDLMASSGGGSWVTVIPETTFYNVYDTGSTSDVDFSLPTEEGGVYAITVDGVRYGASMRLDGGEYPTFEAYGVPFEDAGATTYVRVNTGSKGSVTLSRGEYKSNLDITISVEKLA